MITALDLTADYDWAFKATGAETGSSYDGSDPLSHYDGDGEPASYQPGEKLRARYLTHRVTKRGVLYTWARVPGGRFDRFDTLGLPADLAKAPPPKGSRT